MFTVYALHSPSSDKLYIGFTSDLDLRLLSHNHLSKKGFTVKHRPWVLFHTENFENKAEAMKRERQLKSFKGREFLRSKLKSR
ncbi:MAG TPA: GIY-YIG nuclease family protein [Cyclobacteriaceae bacterium]